MWVYYWLEGRWVEVPGSGLGAIVWREDDKVRGRVIEWSINDLFKNLEKLIDVSVGVVASPGAEAIHFILPGGAEAVFRVPKSVVERVIKEIEGMIERGEDVFLIVCRKGFCKLDEKLAEKIERALGQKLLLGEHPY